VYNLQVIAAEGEQKASRALKEASDIISESPAALQLRYRAGIFKKSMGAMNQGGIGLLYRPARLHRLAGFIPWNQFRGPINI
jgi:hypothetical protein